MAAIQSYINQGTGISTTTLMSQKAITDAIAASGGLASSNGTNYIMVRATGTPEQNADEFRAAYELAKTMPRFLGKFQYIDTITDTLYVGQGIAVVNPGGTEYGMVTSEGVGFSATISYNTGGTLNQEIIKSLRTTIVMAPGMYTFMTANIGTTPAFTHNKDGIDIVSLTGNKDVLVDGINVTANNTYIKGIKCYTTSTNLRFPFVISSGLDKLICENCEGGDFSFGFDVVNPVYVSGTFINCKGGASSFANGGDAAGIFINCEGDLRSFGYDGTASGIFKGCTAGKWSFGRDGSVSGGTFINCVGGIESFGNGELMDGSKFYYCQGGDGSTIANGDVHLFCSVNDIAI